MMDQLNKDNQLIGKTKAQITTDFGTAEWLGWMIASKPTLKTNGTIIWALNQVLLIIDKSVSSLNLKTIP